MTFTKYFAKNRAQGVLLVDSTSQVTFASGHTFPSDTTNGIFFVSIEDEILKATAASEDGSGVLTLTVTRGQDGTIEAIHAADVTGYMYYTAETQNNIYNAVDDIYTGAASLPSLDVTGNITVGGTVDGRNISTDGTKLDGIESGAEANTVDSVNGFTGAVTLVTGNISDTTSTQKYATAAEKTKLSYISVTQPVDLDTMESDIATNNAKVTNANHTGDVTGSATLGIVPAAISGRSAVTPAAGDYVLLWDATDSSLKKSLVDTFISGGGGGGDVTGPSSAVNRSISVYDSTTGKLLTNTNVTISLTDDLENVQNFSALESITLGASNSLIETSIYLWTDDSGVKKNIKFKDASSIVWLLGQEDNYNFEIDRYVNGSYEDTPFMIDNTGGAVYVTTLNSSGLINGRNISSDGTKLDLIDVTGAIDLDTLSAAVTVNSAKVTNANHTGDVTGADVLGIVPAAISGKTGVTPVAGDYVLLWDATDSALKKADVTAFLSGGGAVSSVNGFTGAVTLVTGNISDTTSTQKYATAAQLAKIDYLTITQAVDLDTLESNVATNNAKVTNATHTGDVTGADVLGIVPAAISGKTGVTPAAGDYVLIWDATDSTLKKALVDTFINGSYGDVTGPASSTNTAIAVFNGTDGKTLMNTSVTIDTSSVTIPGFLTVTGQARNSEQTALSTSGIVTWNINNNPIANILLAGDVTSFTISGINLNSNATLYVKQHASSAKTISWPGTITWAGGSAPNLSTVGSKHIISMYSYDGTGLIASAVSDDVLTSVSSTGGTTLANAIAIFDSTTGSSIKDGTGCLDISGNFTNILSINGTAWATLVSDVSTNNAKVSNATHTGEVTGSTTLVIDPTAISGKTAVTPVAGDYLLLWDATDSALKKVDVTNFLGGGSVSSVNGFSGAVTLVTGNISDTTSTQKYATAAQLAKIDYLTVTQAVDLDTMESDIATNNAKVTNATHTGDVTGADVLGIVPEAISGRSAVTAVAGDYVLLWDATDSTLKKADVTDFISSITATSTTTFTNKRITKRVAAITDGTGLDINSDNYDSGYVVLGGNRTLNYFTGTPTNHQQLMIEFIQDATGSRTVTLKDTTGAGSFRVGADITGLVLSSTAGKNDFVLFTYSSDLTGWALTAITKGY